MASPNPRLRSTAILPVCAALAAFAAAYFTVRHVRGSAASNTELSAAGTPGDSPDRPSYRSGERRPSVLDQLGKGSPADDAVLLARALAGASGSEAGAIVRGLEAMHPPADVLERMLLEMAWRRWLTADPSAALAAWFKGPPWAPGTDRRFHYSLSELLAGPAAADPSGLLNAFAGLPLSGRKSAMREDVIWAVANQHARKSLSGLWNALHGPGAGDTLHGSDSVLPLDEILAGIKDPALRVLMENGYGCAQASRSMNLDDVVAWCVSHPFSGGSNPDTFKLGLSLMKTHAPHWEKAWEKALSLPDQSMRELTLFSIIANCDAAGVDMKTALTSIADSPLPLPLREAFASHFYRSQIAGDSGAEWAVISGMPPSTRRKEAVALVFARLGKSGFPDAALLQGFSPMEQNAAVSALLDADDTSLNFTVPEAQPFLELASGSSALADKLARRWAGTAPEEAFAWAVTLPPDQRRAAVRSIANLRVIKDQESAAEWAGTISDPVLRFYAQSVIREVVAPRLR